jgi:aldehyde dehydrogenase (NAD(P)+)
MAQQPSAPDEVDRAIAAVAAHAGEGADLPVAARLGLLHELHESTGFQAERWAHAANAAKGVPQGSPTAGEEWFTGPYTALTGMEALHASLERIWRGHTTYDPEHVTVGPGGRAVVRVMPVDWHDHLLFSGYTSAVWMQPDVTPANLADHTASAYRDGGADPSVCAILGAGNIGAIPILDLVSKLFVECRVCVLKLNPVNDYLGPIFEDIFATMIQRGFVRILYGGADVGGMVTSHPDVDAVHITGSARTHDAIVFGGGDEGERRRRSGDVLLDKPITSELGGATPVIVLPGPWTEADLRYQAEHVATMKHHNSGFNCVAAQVLVLPAQWEHTDTFVSLIEDAIAAAPHRPLYYPGAQERHDDAVARHEDVSSLGATGAPARSHLRDVERGSFALAEEFFTPVLASIRLGGEGAVYLKEAVRFVNEEVHGTLGASIIAHPVTIDALGEDFDAAVEAMRYGCVGVNAWSAVGFSLPRASWGAYPGAPLTDIGSGRGVVHNAYMFDRPEKTVVNGPFRPMHRSWRLGHLHASPKPPWFVTHETAERAARALTAFAADRSLRHLPAVVAAALRG